MADTMQFDLVSPERRLASHLASEVHIPGADGDMTAMPDHAPIITTLRPGILSVTGPDGTAEYAVTGGFAEVSSDGISVLAEKAVPVADMTAEDMDALIADAEATAVGNEGADKDMSDKLLADLAALRTALGV